MNKLLTYTLLLTLSLITFGSHSYAESPDSLKDARTIQLEKMKKMKEERCKKKEKATIGLKLSGSANSFKELSDYVIKTKNDMFEQSALLGVEDIISRNENFSIRSVNNYRSNGNNDKYNLSGNISFESEMVGNALGLAEAMSKIGYNTTYNQTMNQPRCN